MTPLQPRPVPILLMVRALGIGGTERQLALTALSLDRSRFEPHVACWHDEGLRTEELRRANVPILRLPMRSFRSPAAIGAARVLHRYIRENNIRIVHPFDAPSCVFAIPVVWATRSAVILSSQRCHRKLFPPGFRSLLRLTDRMARLIVVNSEYLRKYMIEDEGIGAERLRLCYNGIDLDSFRLPGGPKIRPACLSDASLVIGVICAFRPEKDLATLVKAFATVAPRHPGVRLLLMGEGPEKDRLANLVRELDMVPSVVFAPADPEVAPWLHAIDIFVLPSRSEGLSNSLMEAMASGCATVASNVGGNMEIVRDGATGLLFDQGDCSRLGNCLDRLIGDEGLRRRLACAGTEYLKRTFSTAASAECMASIYSSVAGPSLGGGGMDSPERST